MIRLKEDTRAQLMMAHGFAMLGLGLGLFYIRGAMTNSFFDVIACVFAMLLVTGSLLFIVTVDWICALGLGPPQVFKLRGLLLLSTGAAAGAVFLILYPGSTIGMFCYLIAIYALLLSVGKFSLAVRWKGTKGAQAVMYVLAGIAFFFSALSGDGGSPGGERRDCGHRKLFHLHRTANAALYVLSRTAETETAWNPSARPAHI